MIYLALLGQGCRPSSLTRWQPMSEGIPGQMGVAAVSVASGDPQLLYVAAYEPGGLYRSADGGQTWMTANGGLESALVYALAVSPNDVNVVFAGALDGGYRTTDGGESWQRMLGLPLAPLYSLAVNRDGDTICAGGEETGRILAGAVSWG